MDTTTARRTPCASRMEIGIPERVIMAILPHYMLEDAWREVK
jgi:hypothetical protein